MVSKDVRRTRGSRRDRRSTSRGSVRDSSPVVADTFFGPLGAWGPTELGREETCSGSTFHRETSGAGREDVTDRDGRV